MYALMSFIPPPSLVNWLPFIIISFNGPNYYWNSMNILNISCATEKYCCSFSPRECRSIYNRLVIKSLYNKYLRRSILLVCILQILRFILILVTLQTIKFIIVRTIQYANLCFRVCCFFLVEEILSVPTWISKAVSCYVYCLIYVVILMSPG